MTVRPDVAAIRMLATAPNPLAPAVTTTIALCDWIEDLEGEARRALACLRAFVAEHPDPGSEALGAVHMLTTMLPRPAPPAERDYEGAMEDLAALAAQVRSFLDGATSARSLRAFMDANHRTGTVLVTEDEAELIARGIDPHEVP